MKLDPHLPQLPSINELLEHPRVKSVVARINRSTIAQRATGFLDELRTSLAERTGKVEIPSVTQLAERLARRLLGEPPAGGPVINATGVVVGDPDLTPPLADAALHAMMQVAGDYHDRGGRLRRSAEAELCRLTGAEAALVVGSFEAALHLVLASMAANREILVSQRTAAAGSSIDWPKLAARHGAVLHTSGGELDALAAAAAEKRAVALLRTPEADGLTPTGEVAGIARRNKSTFVDLCPMTGILNPAAYGLQGVETLRERLEAGAELIIADGAGLLGGPTCGIVAGSRALVEAAAAHHLASIAAISAPMAAALQATLAIYREHDQDIAEAAFAIPIWQLLSAPSVNLKQRAERLAALIAATGKVASTEAAEAERTWLRSGGHHQAATTWVIAVRSHAGAATLVSQLQRGPHPIAAYEDDGAVHLDLRSVFPRWDQQLVAAFEGLSD